MIGPMRSGAACSRAFATAALLVDWMPICTTRPEPLKARRMRLAWSGLKAMVFS